MSETTECAEAGYCLAPTACRPGGQCFHRATPTPDHGQAREFAEMAKGFGAGAIGRISPDAVANLARAYLSLARPTPAADGGWLDALADKALADTSYVQGAEDAAAEAVGNLVAALRARPLPDDVRAAVEHHRRMLTMASSAGMCREDIEVSCKELLAHLTREAR